MAARRQLSEKAKRRLANRTEKLMREFLEHLEDVRRTTPGADRQLVFEAFVFQAIAGMQESILRIGRAVNEL